ncbi:putative serine/threonine protein kinase KKQ8 Ecym_8098 [Eremothecium cymbalariae DBVPG|uniref:non-specific serine/threonine protein kinase n=1 Tax=Eremothecium cymbalariae (strain CBS 270.75 / DBVPG 7215 / KCTC 17166 / NRRL Y-17582) TaxID=931890 RepID=G8JX18_ERECY|nr:Hypothetical protein Ecym_8098 [Eremothecium cymbalariae DBVPG\
MPQQVRISRENSVKRSRSLSKSFRGLFKSNSPTPPPSSSTTSASSSSIPMQSPKHQPPLSGIAKLSISPRHDIHNGHNNKSEESVISDDYSVKYKSACSATAFYVDKHNNHDLPNYGSMSASPAVSPAANSDDLRTNTGSSGILPGVKSDDFPPETIQEYNSEASIDAQLEREVTPSLIYPQNIARPHRSTQRSRSASTGKNRERAASVSIGSIREETASKRHKYIIQQDHFTVDEDGNHEHTLKVLPLVSQDAESHKSKLGFSFSGVFKSHKAEEEGELSVAMSILPESSKHVLNKRLNIALDEVGYPSDEEAHSDENYGQDRDDNSKIPKIVNENAAIGKDELKLINNLAEKINNSIQMLNKNSPSDSPPTVKTIKSKQLLAEKYGKCIGMIGHGAYGTVWVTTKSMSTPLGDGSTNERFPRDTYERNGKLFYAIKELKPRGDESQEKFSTRLTSEFVIGHSLSGGLDRTEPGKHSSHPNILKVLDLMQTHDAFIEVFEFCPSGDLYSLLTRSFKSGSGLHPLEADCFMKQLLNGVLYMHDHGVAHCDLKPENILFTPTGVLKICDFGSSSVFQTAWEKRVHFQTGAVGSEPYVAPEEFIARREYDTRLVDCWSCGIIYCTMILGHYLWKVAIKEKDQLYSTFLEDMTEHGEYYVFEELRHVNQELNRCRKMCLYNIFQWNPKKRITIPKILETPWMRHTKCCVNYKTCCQREKHHG